MSAVYHKPVQAFVAGGKLGADQINASREKGDAERRDAAVKTVQQGQKAENVRPCLARSDLLAEEPPR